MALLAESLVEEWLNRDGYFTIRGVKHGVGEMDLLAIRPKADGVEGWHVEVQVSFRPIGYIAKRTAEMLEEFGGKATSAKKRTLEQVESCARQWVTKKYKAKAKAKLRDALWPGVEWSFHLVHAVVREPRELEIFAAEGVTCHPFHELLRDLSKHKKDSFSGSAGGDLAEIVGYYKMQDPSNPVNKSEANETCYMCDAPATGREHIPPRCIFPKSAAYRKNLMKVPSCDLHNGEKSTSDQYLRHVLICALGNNPLALQVADEAAIPRLEKQPHLAKTFLPNLREVSFEGMNTGAFTIDVDRFHEVIGCLVRGLYFRETGKKLMAKLEFMWSALRQPSTLYAPFEEFIRQTEAKLRKDYKGENPKVFTYALECLEEGQHGICRMRFYEGPPIYALWSALPMPDGIV